VVLGGGRTLDVDHIVHLPRLAGPRIAGVPCDAGGFIRADDRGRVDGHADLFAAGDGTTVRIKQGGLAAQQAESVAVAIARRAGLSIDHPGGLRVLRAVLRTRHGPRYLRAQPPAATEVSRSQSTRCGGRPPATVGRSRGAAGRAAGTAPLSARSLHALVRENVAPLDRDRGMHAEVEALARRIPMATSAQPQTQSSRRRSANATGPPRPGADGAHAALVLSCTPAVTPSPATSCTGAVTPSRRTPR
jgi:hypothetical protein